MPSASSRFALACNTLAVRLTLPPAGRTNRVGGGVTPAVLPHHRTCGSASGGSLNTLESSHRIEQRHQPQ
ncbi:MAG: hypothetical protein FJ122_03330, partial [Deltaproteobacteria bacterium]|nr:hypothetical protein [Deltaproteobacteria bacterium]